MATGGSTARWSRGLALALALAAVAAGGRPTGAAAAPLVLAQARGVSADEAAAIVQGAVGGRILDVRLVTSGGAGVWRVKVLLPGGRVRVYRVDAESGRMR